MASIHHLLNVMPNDIPVQALIQDAQDLFRLFKFLLYVHVFHFFSFFYIANNYFFVIIFKKKAF